MGDAMAMGGMGGMDIEAMLVNMKAQGGPKAGEEEEGTDSDDDGPPPLEDA